MAKFTSHSSENYFENVSLSITPYNFIVLKLIQDRSP